MNVNNRYLSGALLVLIGILVGIILVMLQQNQFIVDYSDVRFTEIKKNEAPLVSNKELKKLGGRFLFKEVVDKVLPAVVYISSVVHLEEAESDDEDGDNGFWEYFQERRMRSVGSGVIISEDGYIVTNNHVVAGAENGTIQVILNDKRIFDAHIIGRDPTTDLAVIKIDAENLTAITFGNSNKIDIGEWVLAIGNPFRLRSTVTAGIVSALSRQIQIADGRRGGLTIENFIQTDAAINKGNSGGALVNTSGQLIGINTAIATSSGIYQGYGFAIPSNLVRKVAADLIEDGEIERALLGVAIRTVNYMRARNLGMNTVRGVEIIDMREGGAAASYGLQRHDVILAVNGSAVDKASQLQQKIAILQPGQIVNLKIWRDDEIAEFEVVLDKVKPETQLVMPRTQETLE